MNDLNTVSVIGRCVRDIDERSYSVLPNGTAKLQISIAVNRSIKKGDEYVEETSYFDATMWGKLATTMKGLLCKGKQVGINGELVQDRWEKDGQKMSKVYINVGSIQLLGGGNKTESNSVPSPSANKGTISF